MIKNLKKKISYQLFLFLTRNKTFEKFIYQIFPYAIELDYQEFLFLNNPPLCYDLKERNKELLKISHKRH